MSGKNPKVGYLILVVKLVHEAETAPPIDLNEVDTDMLSDVETIVYFDDPEGKNDDQTGYDMQLVSVRVATPQEVKEIDG